MTQQRVFLSYAREDAARADDVEEVLRNDGHSVWRDIGQIDGGDLWRERIVAALKESDVMVVLVSPRSTASTPVLRELTLASDYGLRVVPVLLEPAEIPATWEFQLAGIHIVDLSIVGIQEVREAVGGTRVAAKPEPAPDLASTTPHTLANGTVETNPAGSPASGDQVGTADTADIQLTGGSEPTDVTEVLPLPDAPAPKPPRPVPADPGAGMRSVPKPVMIGAGVVGAAILVIALVAALDGGAPPTATTVPIAVDEPCTPLSVLACDAIIVDAAQLRFDGDGGLEARDGTGTGFTMVAPPASGTGYDPEALDVADGLLSMTAGPGSAFSDSNDLTNALAVGLNPGSLEVSATIVDLPSFARGNEHAGVWLFVDQNTYVKVNVVGAGDGTTILQALYERDGELIDEARLGDVPSGSTVSVALELDETARTVTAFAGFGPTEADAANTRQRLGVFEADERFLGAAQLEGRPVVFAGLFASRRNSDGPLTVRYTEFSAG